MTDRRLRCRRSSASRAGARPPGERSSVSDGSRGVSADDREAGGADTRQRAGQSIRRRGKRHAQHRAHRRPDRLAIERIAAGRTQQHAAAPNAAALRKTPPTLSAFDTPSSDHERLAPRGPRRQSTAAAVRRAPDIRDARRSRRRRPDRSRRRRRPARRPRASASADSRSRQRRVVHQHGLHAITRVFDHAPRHDQPPFGDEQSPANAASSPSRTSRYTARRGSFALSMRSTAIFLLTLALDDAIVVGRRSDR